MDDSPPDPPDPDRRSPPDQPTLRARAEALVVHAEHRRDDARASMPPVDIAFTAWERDSRIGGFLLAGAIAFRLFVYLLPLYLVLLVVAGAAVAFEPESPESLAGSAGLSPYVASIIGDAGTTAKRSLWILVPVTLWALFTAARSGHRVLAAAHASAWGLPVPRSRKPHLIALGFFGFSLAILAGLIAFRRLHDGVLIPVGMVVSALYYFGVWFVASLRLPRAVGSGPWSVVPGAALVAIGTQALYLFNVLYLNQRIETASEAYGALGIAASLLLWLYLLGRLMVAAPVLNATLWERSHPSDPTSLDPDAGR